MPNASIMAKRMVEYMGNHHFSIVFAAAGSSSYVITPSPSTLSDMTVNGVLPRELTSEFCASVFNQIMQSEKIEEIRLKENGRMFGALKATFKRGATVSGLADYAKGKGLQSVGITIVGPDNTPNWAPSS